MANEKNDKRTAESTETVTAATVKMFSEAEVNERIAAAVAESKPKTRKLTAIFRPPYTKKDGTSSTIASMDLLGCFGGVPMAVKDFALSVPRNGSITVYMPSGMYNAQRVGPIGGELKSDADVAAEATTMEPDEARHYIARHRAKKAAVAVLSDAILNAWASFGAVDASEKFGKPVSIELPE